MASAVAVLAACLGGSILTDPFKISPDTREFQIRYLDYGYRHRPTHLEAYYKLKIRNLSPASETPICGVAMPDGSQIPIRFETLPEIPPGQARTFVGVARIPNKFRSNKALDNIQDYCHGRVEFL